MSNEEQDILVVSGVFPQITYNKKKIVNMLWRNQIAQQGDQNYYHSISSVTQSCPALCDPMNRSMLGLPVHHQLLELPKLMCTELVMPSSHLILCRLLLLLTPTPPSIRVFSNESTLRMRWPKYWSFSLYHYM